MTHLSLFTDHQVEASQDAEKTEEATEEAAAQETMEVCLYDLLEMITHPEFNGQYVSFLNTDNLSY